VQQRSGKWPLSAPGYDTAYRSHRMRSRPTRGGYSLKVLALGNRSVTLEKSVWLAKIVLHSDRDFVALLMQINARRAASIYIVFVVHRASV
jgi:hypothetical protein